MTYIYNLHHALKWQMSYAASLRSARSAINEREALPKMSPTNNNKKLIDISNKAINLILHDTNSNIAILNEILYSTALVITKQNGIKIRKRKLNKS